MMLGIGERQRLGRLGDQADKALALAHCREVDGLAVEAFGGEKFKPPVGAQNIDRADLGHHVRGDEDDDLVQPILRADLLGHDLAQPPQQLPRTARRCRAYGLVFFRPGGLGFEGRHKASSTEEFKISNSGKTPAAHFSGAGMTAFKRARTNPAAAEPMPTKRERYPITNAKIRPQASIA